MKSRVDVILISFIVALFSSLLTALAVLLARTLAASILPTDLISDYFINVFLLFVFSGFVFFYGSKLAAWLLYRHDVAWGYKLDLKRVLPIFTASFIMAAVVFFGVYFFITQEVPTLAYVDRSRELLQSAGIF